MSTDIKILKDIAGHDKGDTITVTDESAARLIERGVAKAVGDTSNTSESDAGDGGEQDDKPAGNASAADWTAYALANGKTEDELKGLKREDIKALFEA